MIPPAEEPNVTLLALEKFSVENVNEPAESETASGIGWVCTLCAATEAEIIEPAEEPKVTLFALENPSVWKLNEPLEVVGTVPSDNSEVRRLNDGLPYVAEGVRLLYCFRRDETNLVSLGEPWTIRASTLIMQKTDTDHGEDARNEFTASDPWAYLFHRPVLRLVGD